MIRKEKSLKPQQVFGTSNQSDERKSGIPVGLSVGKTANAVTKMGLLRRVFLTIAAGLMVIMCIAYLGSAFFTGSSGFTVRASQSGNLDKSISLSETRGFTNGTILLKGPVNASMDNITYTDLPLDNLEAIDGDHSGENYIAYTFYLKNTGTETLNYSCSLIYPRATRGIENAVRICLIQNGEAVVYAAPAANGRVEMYPEHIESFAGQNVVAEELRQDFEPGEVDRYTVIVWLEGEDPECVDSVRRGTMSLEMEFNIVG